MPNGLDSVVVVLRAAAFIALLQAAGAALFLFLFGDRLAASRLAVRRLGITAAATGAVTVALRYLLEPARMTGSLSGVMDGSMHAFLWTSNLGVTQLMRLTGAGILAWALRRASRGTEWLSLAGAALIVASFSFMGHAAASEQRWLLSGLLIVHLLAAAFWFGSLVPLHTASARESLAVTGGLIARFSSVAIRVVPLIFLAGVGQAFVLLPDLSSLGSPYGLFLLVKVAGFTAVMGLAALNKFRLGPAIASGDAASVVLFKRSVAAETVLIASILVVTAAMTTLHSPEH